MVEIIPDFIRHSCISQSHLPDVHVGQDTEPHDAEGHEHNHPH